jgi:hypothetical protein
MYAISMQDKTLAICDRQIQAIKDQLAALSPLRPGSLSRQYRQPRRRQGAYYQISYTLRMRSHTDYVRPNEVAQLRQEIAAYRRFKQLTARWVQVALRRSRWAISRARLGQGRIDSATPAPAGECGGSKTQKCRKNRVAT